MTERLVGRYLMKNLVSDMVNDNTDGVSYNLDIYILIGPNERLINY